MKVCPECNTEYDDSVEFCEKDDTALESVSEETVEENVEEIPAETETAKINLNKTDEVSDSDDEIVADETPEVKTSTASAGASNNSSAMPKILALLAVFLLIGGGLVFWKSKVGGHSATNLTAPITKKDMELILADLNPMMLRQLTQNPEAKKELAGNVRELFALASQAQKDGAGNDENVKRELDNIDYEILAVSYDKAINKDKGPMPPFGFIGEDQVNAFWNGDGGDRTFMDSVGLGSNNAKSREAAFQRFLDAKIALAKEGGNIPADREPSEEEIKQAKDYYAKTRIYYVEALSKKGAADNGLPADFYEKAELQTRLQKAQFLARRYAGKELAEKVKVTDEDVTKYIAEHPDLNIKEQKKATADELLNKVKNGGDFAALAKENSEDPGSKDKGGLYENIAEGAFVPEFEKAVFGGMKPGEIYPELVPTKFGYHIIKLEKLGETKGADGQVKRTFDARHILISTMFKNPNDPTAREMPVEDYVKQILQTDKEKAVLDKIKADNPIEVAEDFDVPTPPAMPEQPQMPPGMMPQQMPPGAEMDETAPPPPPAKPAAKAPPTKPAEPKK